MSHEIWWYQTHFLSMIFSFVSWTIFEMPLSFSTTNWNELHNPLFLFGVQSKFCERCAVILLFSTDDKVSSARSKFDTVFTVIKFILSNCHSFLLHIGSVFGGLINCWNRILLVYIISVSIMHFYTQLWNRHICPPKVGMNLFLDKNSNSVRL